LIAAASSIAECGFRVEKKIDRINRILKINENKAVK